MGSIRLKFPNHAQDMLQYRNINVDDLKKAIRDPDFTKPLDDGRLKVCKQVGEGKAITVVYYKESTKGTNDYLIITAYYKNKC